MNQNLLIAEVLQRRAERRESRRAFMKIAGGTTAAVAGSAFLMGCHHHDDDNDGGTGNNTTTPPVSAITDADVLNFALNLEYLEAEFYSYAVHGHGIDDSLKAGTGTMGTVTAGHAVKFTDPVVKAYATEIAADELAHVKFLRTALGSAAVAEPSVDVGTDPAGAFSTAARAAGLVGDGESFDPYASDENFLLGAFIFEDVGVSAYKGASPLISNSTYLGAAAGILAAEAYHAGLVRTVLYRKGIETPALITAAGAISDARDSLDGPGPNDYPIVVNGQAKLVPTDANGIVRSRSAAQVLDIVYLTNMAATKGGFFPNGVNGTINTSAASG